MAFLTDHQRANRNRALAHAVDRANHHPATADETVADAEKFRAFLDGTTTTTTEGQK